MDAIQAAVLRVKLDHLESWIKRRREIAKKYDRYFANSLNEIVYPTESEWAKHVYHLYVIKTDKRDELKLYLESHNIECGIHYPASLPSLKAYQNHNQYKMMGNEEEGGNLLSLPIGEHLSDQQIDYVTEVIDSFN